ncbi:Cerevisin [Dactylellina cionopaga]|nr:Cerevisin [Dactylellina cionopaga]
MKESEAEDMSDHPSIITLEKAAKRHWAVLPKVEADQPKDQAAYTEDRKFQLRKRQDASMVYISQGTAPWNLQRISCPHQIDIKNRRPTDLNYEYRYDQAAGRGVDVYVVDSGINVDHKEFNGRAQMIFGFFGQTKDDVGHGTHCAGTIGSLHFGVAKNVNILGVKVGNSAGVNGAAIVAGIDAVISRHNERKTKPDFVGSVINMSIGTSPPVQSDFEALKKATAAGIHAAVAAMNAGADACTWSPGSFSQQIPIINVGATDINDNRAQFSNYGKCVDIYAPGVSIVSTFNNNATGLAVLDGTSMAAPAVTGMIADELVKNPTLRLDPAGMKKLILSKALKGVIKLDTFITGGEVALNNGFPGDP